MIIHRTKEILKKYNLYPKKKYGQNFLIDENILNKIIDSGLLNKEVGVIEIGPGIGTLTEALSLHAMKVLCYEIDAQMINVLKDALNKYHNITIIHCDFLKVKLQDDIDKYLSDCKEVIVVANLPYYITTPIIFKLMNEEIINKMLIMVQKEMGLRLVGKPNTKDYNALSVLMAYKTKTNIYANVSRNSFFPVPNVDSVLLNIEIVENDYGINNEGYFFEFIQTIFMQRRKTLVNNIIAKYPLSKDDLVAKIRQLGYDVNIRAESLSLLEIIELFKTLFG